MSQAALADATRRVEADIGGRLSDEQQQALRQITGPGGLVVLEGQAGTGKGVVIKTAAQAWRQDGYAVLGTAVAGATAERLGADANLSRSSTADSLIARDEQGTLGLDQRSVLVMDEAGMADTKRLAKLVEIAQRSESKLLLVGDAKQLSAIGAGGLFDQIKDRVPHAQLSEVRRARHDWERQAWQQLRDGNTQDVLAAYQARERLHVTDTREQAAEQMVMAWDRDRREVGDEQAVMLTDASNVELDRINEMAQQLRDECGELGDQRVPLKGRPYELAAGDRVIFTASHHQPGGRRVENGSLGTIRDAGEDGRLTIATAGPHGRVVSVDTREFQSLKLAYAQHVYKAQGLTVERAQVLLGGWQTDRERAYVALSRARERTDIHITRTDLGEEGMDAGAIERLGEAIAESNAQEASISRQEHARTEQETELGAGPPAEPARDAPVFEGAEASREPLSEVGRILAEQEERERLEAERDDGLGFGI